jgi:hypothetical protein
MLSADFHRSPFRNIAVIDEDFLAERGRIDEMMKLNATEIDKPILFSCLTSLQSLSHYTIDELLSMGLGGVWVGIESKRAGYPKLKNIDAAQMLAQLKRFGVIPLTSMIIGYDWHNEQTVEEDFQYLLSLRPAFSQIMIYSPCPQTPLYQRLADEGRLISIPYKFHDGFHMLFKHPNFSAQRLERFVEDLFMREYEELGPSVCRVLDVQLSGYQTLRDSPIPLYRARAQQHGRLCLEIYPLLSMAIRQAPSQKVREYLVGLQERVTDEFRIPTATRFKQAAVPLLVIYSRLKDWLIPHPQPPTLVHRFRFT